MADAKAKMEEADEMVANANRVLDLANSQKSEELAAKEESIAEEFKEASEVRLCLDTHDANACGRACVPKLARLGHLSQWVPVTCCGRARCSGADAGQCAMSRRRRRRLRSTRPRRTLSRKSRKPLPPSKQAGTKRARSLRQSADRLCDCALHRGVLPPFLSRSTPWGSSLFSVALRFPSIARSRVGGTLCAAPSRAGGRHAGGRHAGGRHAGGRRRRGHGRKPVSHS